MGVLRPPWSSCLPWAVRLKGRRKRLTRKAPQPLSPAPTRGPVEADMRHVLDHVDDRVILQIAYLRGALPPNSG